MNQTETPNEASQTPAPDTETPAAQTDATQGGEDGGAARLPIDPALEFLTPELLARIMGKSRKEIYYWNKAGLMPAPVALPGKGTNAKPRLHWRRREIEAWLAAGCPPRKKWEEMQARNHKP